MTLRLGLAALALAASAGLADAQQVEELFSHKHWKVSGVAWDDGTVGCVAEVSAPGESFSIWTLQDGTVSLQFYSTAWSFGDSDTADLEVQIDRRAPWSLTGAELSQNSVYFNIPGSDAGGNFVAEIARGMGAEGLVVDRLEDVGPTLRKAIDLQMNQGKTCVIEILCTRELGDPFRRDALRKPVRLLDKYRDFV